MTWQDRFDRLLKGMSRGEPHNRNKSVSDMVAPHKAEKRASSGSGTERSQAPANPRPPEHGTPDDPPQ